MLKNLHSSSDFEHISARGGPLTRLVDFSDEPAPCKVVLTPQQPPVGRHPLGQAQALAPLARHIGYVEAESHSKGRCQNTATARVDAENGMRTKT